MQPIKNKRNKTIIKKNNNRPRERHKNSSSKLEDKFAREF